MKDVVPSGETAWLEATLVYEDSELNLYSTWKYAVVFAELELLIINVDKAIPEPQLPSEEDTEVSKTGQSTVALSDSVVKSPVNEPDV